MEPGAVVRACTGDLRQTLSIAMFAAENPPRPATLDRFEQVDRVMPFVREDEIVVTVFVNVVKPQAGLTSLCSIPAWWMWPNAAATCRAIISASATGSGRSRSSRARNVSPSRSGATK